ncbi:MAG: alpha-amylase family glycosyl hydrolase [Bacteroidota bacterium]|nr:alpha-amylase family glycosyl hydrolase [Bacteroidota bacterium]
MIPKACRPLLVLPFILLLMACHSKKEQETTVNDSNEVIYHIFLRSFYDSDGDGNGDLKGLQEKLDYLQDLGITAILVTPVNSSKYYHNYFSDDFEKIDPAYGNDQSFSDLMKAVHQKGMKFYLDMETQYITEDHAWWKDSYKNPSSKYSNYIVYNGKDNTDPEPIIFNMKELPGYNGVKRKVATVNLSNKDVLEYNYTLFKHWMDPNNDGKFEDGVDGFRLDHAMDDLDWKGKWTGLFEKFWHPLLTRLKQINPGLMIVAEQANWADYGKDYFEKAGVDRVFAFKLQNAFVSFDKHKLSIIIDSTFSATPPANQQVVFLENHDMERSASKFGKDPGKERAGAALNLLVGGIPSIYYGQELGMPGTGGFGKFGMTDANDIPRREAFEWYKDDSSKGMALWYKNTGPWWDSTNLKANDGISLEEEKPDTASLYNFYKTLLRLRKSHEALSEGKYQAVSNNNEQVFTFMRYTKKEKLFIALNLSATEQKAATDINGTGIRQEAKAVQLYPAANAEKSLSGDIVLAPYGVYIWKFNE